MKYLLSVQTTAQCILRVSARTQQKQVMTLLTAICRAMSFKWYILSMHHTFGKSSLLVGCCFAAFLGLGCFAGSWLQSGSGFSGCLGIRLLACNSSSNIKT